MFNRIVCNPEILGGKPTIKGTRISVEIILEWIASGGTPDTIVQEYNHLKKEDVEQALRYAAASFREGVVLQTNIAP
ncbi:hypothetical protein LF1_16240 [Rubripirellula obstinata]|uniref:DUF433 domain-containing protein n=1 Tax=Rubripirellula obstinata TaxID=406547 RepID=A0A5B1CEV8_9BACT|nr:DUF433 domain-containing protein [Rubripirellula obstinata]KAA1259096.1 hypothetical protein LF1_16240 [Rubripirellula obstinata]